MTYRRFLFYDGLGAALWSGLWIGTGLIFGREIDRLLERIESAGGRIGWIAALGIAAWIAVKAVQRWRLKRLYRARRIGAEEVKQRMADGEEIVILDARSALALQADPRVLPASERWEDVESASDLGTRYSGRLVVTFCTCPNEASAAVVAQRLIAAGHTDVRVLARGEEALSIFA
jgi:hypothetical protein